MMCCMKKTTIGATLLGLLFLGTVAWPQDPPKPAPSAARIGPPHYQDVLRGRVGQKCDATLADGVWTLSFPAGVMEPRDEADEMLKVDEEMLKVLKQVLPEDVLEYNEALQKRKIRTLASVGSDFVRLEKENGTEGFIPLSRVDVVVIRGN